MNIRTSTFWTILLCGLIWPVSRSLQAQTKESPQNSPSHDFAWHSIKSDDGHFQVEMPGDPKISSAVIRPLPEHEVEVHLLTVSVLAGKALFLVGYHDLDFTPQDDKKIKDVLDGGVKGTVLNTLGKLTKHEATTLDKHPGRAFEYAGKRFGAQIRGTSRIYLVGSRIFQLTVLSTPEVDVAREATKFFDSFKLPPEVSTGDVKDEKSTEQNSSGKPVTDKSTSGG